MTKCKRCNHKINPAKSAFCVLVKKTEHKVIGNMAMSTACRSGDVAIHVNGDRECTKEVAGYRKMLLEALEMTADCDISFLDNF